MKSHVHRIREEALTIILFVVAIWVFFFLDLFLPLEQLGLIPRDFGGLSGIVFMPFLHADLDHLVSNTLPLLLLLVLLAGSRADSRLIVALIVLLGGVLLWLFGRGNAIHVGASLLIFGLASFLIASGIMERRAAPMLISIVIALLYGSTLLAGILPWQQNVSWDGHLMGGVAGVTTAWLLIRNLD